MIFLYTYISGVVVVLLLLIFVKWLRPTKKDTIWVFTVLLLFSWITVIIVISVLFTSWKTERSVMRDSQKED